MENRQRAGVAVTASLERPRQLDQFVGRRHQAGHAGDDDRKEGDQESDDDARQIGCTEHHHDDWRNGNDRRGLDDDKHWIERSRQKPRVGQSHRQRDRNDDRQCIAHQRDARGGPDVLEPGTERNIAGLQHDFARSGQQKRRDAELPAGQFPRRDHHQKRQRQGKPVEPRIETGETCWFRREIFGQGLVWRWLFRHRKGRLWSRTVRPDDDRHRSLLRLGRKNRSG